MKTRRRKRVSSSGSENENGVAQSDVQVVPTAQSTPFARSSRKLRASEIEINATPIEPASKRSNKFKEYPSDPSQKKSHALKATGKPHEPEEHEEFPPAKFTERELRSLSKLHSEFNEITKHLEQAVSSIADAAVDNEELDERSTAVNVLFTLLTFLILETNNLRLSTNLIRVCGICSI